MSFAQIINEILILILYVLIGFAAKKLKLLSDSGIQDISRIVVNIAMPFLVISSLIITYQDEYVRNMLYIAVLTFIFLAFVALTSWKISTSYTTDLEQRNALNYSMMFGNTIFLGYPLCYALFGQLGVFYASIYVAVQNIFQWTFGVYIFRRERITAASLKRLINPGLIAIFVGLTIFFAGLPMPEPLDRVLKGVGAISIPLSLMVIGATLNGYRLRKIIRDKGVQLAAFCKIAAFPVVFLALLYFIPIDKSLKAILTIEAAAPVQASAAVFAKNFGGDSLIVAKCVMLSTLEILITIPLFLWLITR